MQPPSECFGNGAGVGSLTFQPHPVATLTNEFNFQHAVSYWCFIDGPKLHRFELAAWNRQTDRQTDRQVDGQTDGSQHRLMLPYCWEAVQQMPYTLANSEQIT